jgi:hypothetical protein
LKPTDTTVSSTRTVSFLEPLEIESGSYDLTVVLSRPEQESPYAAHVKVMIPAIPRHEPFLVGPFLGRRAEENIVFYGTGGAPSKNKKSPPGATPAGDRVGSSSSFQPILVYEVDRTEPIIALTEACVVKPRSNLRPYVAVRSLATEGAATVGGLDPLPLDFSGDEPVRCQNLMDLIPLAQIKPGEYDFEATLQPASDAMTSASRLRFLVGTEDDGSLQVNEGP